MVEPEGFGPLQGVTVVDMTQYQQGPVATRMLAEMGAEVIKVEPRLTGDGGRYVGAVTEHGLSTYFEETCRCKKSITLDIRKEKGLEILYKLVERADVFAENFRVGVAERRGFAYDDFRRINPSIVYVKMSGWGLKGPSAKLPAYDSSAQAVGGMASMAGEKNAPMMTMKVAVGDQVGGFLAFSGALLALFHRERTGQGQMVDSSLIGGQIALMGWYMQQYLLTGIMFPRSRHRITFGSGSAMTGHFRGKDGKWFNFQVVGQETWKRFFKAMGMEEILADPLFDTPQKIDANQDAFFAPLEKLFLTKDREEWLRFLREHNFVCAPINNFAEAACDPDVIANDYVTEVDHPRAGRIKVVGIPIKLSETPGKIGVAPELGQHTEEILERFGYSSGDIAELRREEVI